MKEIAKSADIGLIVQAENNLILSELNLYAPKDPSVLSSLNAAVIDFIDIKNAIEVVKIPEVCKAAAATYRAKKKLQGVVVDGAHEALNGHITRLANRIRAVGISVAEKNVLRQRQANMRTMKELYIALQYKALGIEPLVRKKALGKALGKNPKVVSNT